MVKELSTVKENVFLFVNGISSDLKTKLESNSKKLDEALINISGLAETVVEMQLLTSSLKEKSATPPIRSSAVPTPPPGNPSPF